MAEKIVTPARVMLAAAATLAAIAVGIAGFRGHPAERAPAPPANSQAGQAPGNVGDMIAQLEARLKGNTSDADGWRLLGWAYFETGRYADSANAYAKAVKIDPGKAEYWSALGEATVMSEKAGISPGAEMAFRKAIEVDPKDARARYFLAVKKDLSGDHEGAVADWIAILKDGPANAPWAADVRQLVRKVAAENRIDIAGQLPPAPPAGPSGADVATAGIPGPTREQLESASSLTPAQQSAMVQAMVDKLAARLAADPKDADGWIRLMRARMVLNDAPAARKALADARAAFAGDQASLARIGEAAKALGIVGA